MAVIFTCAASIDPGGEQDLDGFGGMFAHLGFRPPLIEIGDRCRDCLVAGNAVEPLAVKSIG
jgi:hypothetical protein